MTSAAIDSVFIWASAFLAVGGLLTLIARWVRSVYRIVKTQMSYMEYVQQELRYNGGSSLRDRQWRTEQKLDLIVTHLKIELPPGLEQPHFEPPVPPPPPVREKPRHWQKHHREVESES